nr:NnrU family protein [Dissulfurirhabdus thermomarina]
MAAGWLAFFAWHSVLAADGPKAWAARHLPRLAPAWRLAYNVASTAWVAVLVALEHRVETPVAWDPLSGPLAPFTLAADAAAAVFFASALLRADPLHFAGIRQILVREVDPPDRLVTTGPWRWIRHPLFASGIVLVWGRRLEVHQACSALLITLYLVVGARLEERRLLRRFGDDYRRYMERTGRFLPRAGRRRRDGTKGGTGARGAAS